LLGCERLSIARRRALDRLAEVGGCHLSAMSLWEAQMLHSKGASFAGSALLGLAAPGFSPWCRCAAAAECEASRSRVGGLALGFAALARRPGYDLFLLQELQSRLRRSKQGRPARLSGTTDADDLQQLDRGDREP